MAPVVATVLSRPTHPPFQFIVAIPLLRFVIDVAALLSVLRWSRSRESYPVLRHRMRESCEVLFSQGRLRSLAMQLATVLRHKMSYILCAIGMLTCGCFFVRNDLHATSPQDVVSTATPIASEVAAAENTDDGIKTETAAESVAEAVSEEDELCRPVIKVLVRRRENAEVAALRRDVQANAFDQVAVDIQVGSRIKDQPKIMVPVAADRYKVWYGYHSGIRAAVLRTAAEYAKTLPGDDAQNGVGTSEGGLSDDLDQTASTSSEKPAAISQSKETPDAGDGDDETAEGVREGGYPTRTSWWTVGKKHPEKEGMVTHLSGGPHKKKFDLAWLETLTRDELHSLHSDDHEKKVNWGYARKYVEPPEPEPQVDPEPKGDPEPQVESEPQVDPDLNAKIN